LTVKAEQPEHAQPVSRGGLARLLGLPRRLTVVGLTALIALAAASIGLAFDLWPGLKPDPEVQLNATIKPLGLETKVWYRDYLQRTGRSSARRGKWGELVYLQVETEGLKGHESQLRWYLYNKRERARLARQPRDNVQLVSGTTSDRYVVPVWVQPPTDKGTYFLRFELRAKGVLLAIANSPSFPNCASAGCGAPRRATTARGS
jgi:hypothetical protein